MSTTRINIYVTTTDGISAPILSAKRTKKNARGEFVNDTEFFTIPLVFPSRIFNHLILSRHGLAQAIGQAIFEELFDASHQQGYPHGPPGVWVIDTPRGYGVMVDGIVVDCGHGCPTLVAQIAAEFYGDPGFNKDFECRSKNCQYCDGGPVTEESYRGHSELRKKDEAGNRSRKAYKPGRFDISLIPPKDGWQVPPGLAEGFVAELKAEEKREIELAIMTDEELSEEEISAEREDNKRMNRRS